MLKENIKAKKRIEKQIIRQKNKALKIIKRFWERDLAIVLFIMLVISGTAFADKSVNPLLSLETWGHRAFIWDLFFFAHGTKLISGGDDKVIRIFDVSNPRWPLLINTIRGEIGEGKIGAIQALALSPDEKILAVGGILYDQDMDKSLTPVIRLHELATGRIVGLLKGHKDTISDLAFSPDGKYLALASTDLIIWKKEKENWLFYKRLSDHQMPICTIAFSKERLASGSFDRAVRLYDQDFKLIKVLDKHNDCIQSVIFSPDGKYLITAAKESNESPWGTILLWSKDGNFIKTLVNTEVAPSGLAISKDGRYLLAGGYSDPGTCYLYEFPKGRVKVTFKHHKMAVHAVGISPHPVNPIMATGGGDNNEIILWDDQGRVLSRIEGGGRNIWACGLGQGGRRIGFGTTKYPSPVQSTELESQQKATEVANEVIPIEWVFDLGSFTLKKEDGQYLTRAKTENKRFKLSQEPFDKDQEKVYSVLTLEKDGKIKTKIITSESLCYTFLKENFIASGGRSGNILIYNKQGETIARLVGHTGAVRSLAVSPEGTWLASAGDDQVISLWYVGNLPRKDWPDKPIDWEELEKKPPDVYKNLFDKRSLLKESNRIDSQTYLNWLKSFYLPIENIKPSLTLFFTQDGEWVVWTCEGFFNMSSDKALKFVGYHLNQGFKKQAKFVCFNQLYDVFYKPDLIRDKLDYPTKAFSTETKIIERALAFPPPEVEIISPLDGTVTRSKQIKVRIRIDDAGSGRGDSLLYHNGKLIKSLRGDRFINQENKVIKKEVNQPLNHMEETFTINLISGENIISFCSLNGDNSVSSAMAKIKVKALIEEIKPSLFLLSIGVKDFKDPDVGDLNYSIYDSNRVSRFINEASIKLYDKVKVYTLKNPTRQKVVETVEEISRWMKPEDLFLFYASTHGYIDDYRYYLYTTETTKLPKGTNSLTSDSLAELLILLPALKQVVILDTCSAGGLNLAIANLYQTRHIMQAKRGGIHIMAAAGQKEAFESEIPGYGGGGLFTYCLLEALKGEADTDCDGKITIHETGQYLREKVPLIYIKLDTDRSQKVKKDQDKLYIQTPNIRLYGLDVALAVGVNKECQNPN